MSVAPLEEGASSKLGRRTRPALARRRPSSVLLAPLYGAYTRRLRQQVQARPLPRHVAVILDGNRRWATLAGLRGAGAGHRHGADRLDELLAWCGRLGVSELTVWALSTENLARGSGEVAALVDVVSSKLLSLAERGSEERWFRVRVFGRTELLPGKLVDAARRVEEATAANEGLCLNIALGYSGRDELVDATRALVRTLLASGVSADELAGRIDADGLQRHLYTADHTDPDLIIRTSGEMRLSGFLPWQSSHSEFYFTDVYWPAFRELDLLRAIRTFQARERRYGR